MRQIIRRPDVRTLSCVGHVYEASANRCHILSQRLVIGNSTRGISRRQQWREDNKVSTARDDIAHKDRDPARPRAAARDNASAARRRPRRSATERPAPRPATAQQKSKARSARPMNANPGRPATTSSAGNGSQRAGKEAWRTVQHALPRWQCNVLTCSHHARSPNHSHYRQR